MSAVALLENTNFNPRDYNANEWFIEQDSFKLCTYDDKPIDIPVLVIQSILYHYKYYISFAVKKPRRIYECLGTTFKISVYAYDYESYVIDMVLMFFQILI